MKKFLLFSFALCFLAFSAPARANTITYIGTTTGAAIIDFSFEVAAPITANLNLPSFSATGFTCTENGAACTLGFVVSTTDEIVVLDPGHPSVVFASLPTNFFSTTGSPHTALSAGGGTTTLNLTVAATPEPSSLILLGTGALGMIGAFRRRIR